MSSNTLDWVTIDNELVQHFKSAERLATILDISAFLNSFEQWFTVECLSVILRKFPTLKVSTNEDVHGFSKPDIALSDTGFVAVIEVKHLNPLSIDCQGRWNGAKGSTVAKDICKLYTNANKTAIKRVLVFYGYAQTSNHVLGGTCTVNRGQCLACSIADLQGTVLSNCGLNLSAPRAIPLFPGSDENFYLLVFTV